jgi:hypothetical protein
MSLSYSNSFVVLLILKFASIAWSWIQVYGSMLAYAKLKCMVWRNVGEVWMVGCVS